MRWAGESLDDAEIAIVAYGTSARVARTAIERARERGFAVGLFRPITLWPFPSEALAALAPRLRAILVVEMSAGQMSRTSGSLSATASRSCSTGGWAAWSRRPARWSTRSGARGPRPSQCPIRPGRRR